MCLRHRPRHGPLRRRAARSWSPATCAKSGVELAAAFSDGVRAEGVDVDRPRHGLDRLPLLRLGPPRLRRAPCSRRRTTRRSTTASSSACPARARSGATPAWPTSRPSAEKLLGEPRAAAHGRAGASSTCSTSGPTTSCPSSTCGSLRPLKVVADTANGMGGLVVPIVFDRLPFTRRDPLPRARRQLPEPPGRPDPAREPRRPEGRPSSSTGPTSAWPSTGTPTGSSSSTRRPSPSRARSTTALVAASMLTKHPGETILYNLICSHVVPEVVTEMGGTAVRTQVGHSIIKKVMAETGRRLRRRALGPLLLPRQLPGRLGHHHGARSCSSCSARATQPLSALLAAVPALRRLGRDQHRGGQPRGHRGRHRRARARGRARRSTCWTG